MPKPNTMADRCEYRRKERAAAAAFLKAFCSEVPNLAPLTEAYWAVEKCRGSTAWRTIIRMLAREKPTSDSLHQMFFAGEVWGSLPLAVKDDPALFDALRSILPPYSGRKRLRSFRGASDCEIDRRIGARSWSTRIRISESFAREHNNRI